MSRSPGALTFGYGCTVHVGVDVGAGDMEINVIYTRGAGASARYSRAAATPKALRRSQMVEMCEDEE